MIRCAYLLGVFLLLSACALVSDKPLLPPRYAVRDPQLEGLWRCDMKNGPHAEQGPLYLYVTYGPSARGSILAFGNSKDGPGAMSWDFFVIRTAKHAYLNMNFGAAKMISISGNQRKVPQRAVEGYMFMEYHFSWTGQLVISDVGGGSFSNAVKEGKLRGKTDLFVTEIRHERPGRLLAFIEAAKPEDVFEKPWIAKKIGTP